MAGICIASAVGSMYSDGITANVSYGLLMSGLMNAGKELLSATNLVPKKEDEATNTTNALITTEQKYGVVTSTVLIGLVVLGSTALNTYIMPGADSSIGIPTTVALGSALGTTLSLLEQSVAYDYAYKGISNVCETSKTLCQSVGSAMWNTCSFFGKKCENALFSIME